MTRTEIEIIDNYIIANYDKLTCSVFYQAVANTLPSGRSEELYEHDAYTDYLLTLLTKAI